MRKKAREIFGRLGMEVDLDARVSDLGVATKQMVEIAKALSLRLRDPHPGRADGRPDEQGSRHAFRDHPQAEGPRRLDALYQPPPGRDLPDRGPGHGHPRRGVRPDRGRLPRHAGPAGLLDGRPHPRQPLPQGRRRHRRGRLRGARHRARRVCSTTSTCSSAAGRSSASRGLPAPAARSWRCFSAALRAPDAGEILIDGKRVHISDYRDAMEQGIVLHLRGPAEVRPGGPHDDQREHHPAAAPAALRLPGHHQHGARSGKSARPTSSSLAIKTPGAATSS